MYKRFQKLVFPIISLSVACLSIALPMSAWAANESSQWQVVEDYCYQCHNDEDWAGSVAFNLMSAGEISHEAEVFEEAIRRLKGGHMPPPGADRPEESELKALVAWLENTIDEEAGNPPAGNVPLRRLNRREYENAIRDLLALEIDAGALLPEDDLEGGFDNNAAALQVSPTFIDQYLNAARTIAHNAIGDRRPIPIMETFGSEADMIISLPARGTPGTGVQQSHMAGMPFGTRGGMSIRYNFMADGEYELNIGDLALGREVPNMEFKNTVIALLDGKEIFRTELGGDDDHEAIDQEQADAVSRINLRLKGIRFNATAGQHIITVTFLQRSFAESDDRRPALALEGGQSRIHKVHALQIRGPLKVTGMSESASRKRIFVCYPRESAEEKTCATEIITNLAERAFRRPLEQEDVDSLVGFFESSRLSRDFEASVKEAVSAILVSPHFIYRAEGGAQEGESILLSDLELASRLSFFLWSSLPDEELLTLANEKKLGEPAVLKAQISRMIADDRAKTLVEDFAFQWLNLAKLDEISPNGGLFRYASRFLDPRPMFKQELSLFIDSILRSDQSVVRLLDSDYTFLNERLAAHYGIENVKGSAFRKVSLDDEYRKGLLGKGAILMLTANPNRTSPVLRGAWILERILASPPPPPPPNVETDLAQKPGQAPQTLRARLEQHRENPSCYTCHGVLDPLGFALENFNTVGQFQEYDLDTLSLIDASGVLPDGTRITSPGDLVTALVTRSDEFVQSLTEHLMTYALGRLVEYQDMPAVRKIVRASEQDDYRFESIVFNIVSSDAFRMRESMLSASQADTPQQASL
ncbi:MAG: DUF1592 domain-containing protein [Gammaproteobacteria bacterium]|jgi:hypothetical protein|nr:DUF1592 domain-containing protein [Gammaproteobacteria bacterium]